MSKQSSANQQINYAARSDVGMKRAMNQDAYDATLASADDWQELGHRFVVADGMGAHAAGELASQLAVEEFRREYEESRQEPRIAIVQALEAANSVIHQRGQADTQLFNMGTTCSSLLILPEGALVGHIGDSRVYRCRNDRIQQLTFDHSLVWEMRAAGQATGDRGAAIPRNVITRCLGPHADVDVDLEGFFSVQVGDTFLLCSDGLTGRISDKEIGTVIRHLEPNDAVDFLTDLANLRGGSDNITVIVARVLSEELQADGEVRDAMASNEIAGTHPAWWLAAGGGLVTAMAAYQFEHMPIASVGAAAFVVATAGAIVQFFRQRKEDNTLSRPSAPYATASTRVDREFVDGILEPLNFIIDALESANADVFEVSGKMGALMSSMETQFPPGDSKKPAIATDGTSLCKQLASIAKELRARI